jgi:hypothetical protein
MHLHHSDLSLASYTPRYQCRRIAAEHTSRGRTGGADGASLGVVVRWL